MNKSNFDNKFDSLLVNMEYKQIKEIKNLVNEYINSLECKINKAKKELGCDGMCGATNTWETMNECRSRNL